MKRRIAAIFTAVAVIVSMTVFVSAADLPDAPRTAQVGDFTIGFFGSDNRLEVRINRQVTEGMAFLFYETMVTRAGITRVRIPTANDDIQGTGGAGREDANELVFAGYTKVDTLIPVNSTVMRVTVDGTGNLTLNGEMRVQFGEGEEITIPVNNITVTNRRIPGAVVIPPVNCCGGDCLMGDVDNNGIVSISDVLEILMFLAGLDTNIIETDGIALNHSMILPESQQANRPSIGDVLEILKALASLPNTLVTRLSR
jgi:hypothetical protein